MYKCLDCGQLFETPKEYIEEEKIYEGCPDRECRGAYLKAFKCSYCEDYKLYDEIYGDMCIECAEKEYTDRLGLKYLDSHKESYLDFYGVEQVDRDLKANLIEVLEKDYQSKIDMDTDWNHKLKDLKEYILNDMDEWVKFLKEEI
jgi:hypothetical protein